jgi:hypothetical protein
MEKCLWFRHEQAKANGQNDAISLLKNSLHRFINKIIISVVFSAEKNALNVVCVNEP